jgi:hypothetical protein
MSRAVSTSGTPHSPELKKMTASKNISHEHKAERVRCLGRVVLARDSSTNHEVETYK